MGAVDSFKRQAGGQKDQAQSEVWNSLASEEERVAGV